MIMTIERINAGDRLAEIFKTDMYRVMEGVYGQVRTLTQEGFDDEADELTNSAWVVFRGLHLEIDALKAVESGLYSTYEEALPQVTALAERVIRENAEIAAEQSGK